MIAGGGNRTPDLRITNAVPGPVGLSVNHGKVLILVGLAPNGPNWYDNDCNDL